jgi:hypothetical protein
VRAAELMLLSLHRATLKAIAKIRTTDVRLEEEKV